MYGGALEVSAAPTRVRKVTISTPAEEEEVARVPRLTVHVGTVGDILSVLRADLEVQLPNEYALAAEIEECVTKARTASAWTSDIDEDEDDSDEEKRCLEDSVPYSKTEFMEFFGDYEGVDKWKRATIVQEERFLED